MIRLALIFLFSYAYGHGHFTSYRPHVVDKPLVGFHETVNKVVADISGVQDDAAKAMQPTRILHALNVSF
jgi:hypothetical protein